MANKLAIVVGSVALFIIALLLFQGHNLKRQLKESQEDLADEKVRSKRSQRQNVDYESRIRDLEVALRQKTEQQNTAQADLDEAEQQIQEKTDFLKEVQQALEAMAVRFSIDIDAEETLATTVIQMISDRLQETINGLRKESAAAKELAQKHASSVENAEESKGQLQSDLDEARKKAENAVKDLEQLKNDYKKLNTVIKALIAAGDTNNDELKKQQEAVDKQAKAVDDKLKTVATPAPTKPATNPPTPAPTTPAPTPAKVEKADDTYGADDADTANNQADENADDAGENADENVDDNADENTENDTAKVDTGADANADANTDGGDETAEKPAADKKATYTASSGQALPQKKGKEEDYGTN